MTPFEAYKCYLAVQQHFKTKSYDYVKYNGSIGAKQETFESRKDKWFFHKLSKRPDVLGWLVANHVDRDKIEWIGNLINDPESDKIYARWVGRKQAMDHHMQQQLRSIDFQIPNSIIVPEDGSYPHLLEQFQLRKVTADVMIVLNDIHQFFDYWSKRISDSVLWPAVRQRLDKAASFIEYDAEAVESMLERHRWGA